MTASIYKFCLSGTIYMVKRKEAVNLKLQSITEKQIQKFRKYLVNEEKSDATIEKYIRDVTAFVKWLDGEIPRKERVIQYKERLIAQYKTASVNSILSSLNMFFEYADWHKMKVKTLKTQRMIFADKSKELTKTEYEKLLTAAKDRKNEKLYYLIQTIASTGLRVSEIKFITFEAIKRRQAIINCKGKIRQVFLPKKLCIILQKYASKQGIKSGSIFVTRTGTPLDRSNIWRMLKELCESAGVSKEKVFPHNFRHLFARTYYSLQKDIVRLADILGHSNINTTRIYTAESGTEHMKQLQKLGFLRC